MQEFTVAQFSLPHVFTPPTFHAGAYCDTWRGPDLALSSWGNFTGMAQVNTRIRACLALHAHMYTYALIHAWTQTHKHIYTLAYTHAYTRNCTHIHVQTHTHTHTYTHTQLHTHTCSINTHTHTHKHTHTHIHRHTAAETLKGRLSNEEFMVSNINCSVAFFSVLQ
jgi:hypothetical protein